MPGPSKDVQGGYLGYSALTDSYNKSLAAFRGARTERLEQEKLELANEETIDDMFTLPQEQQTSVAGSKGRSQPKTTVVTNGGFSFTANPEDALQKNMLTPDLGLDKTPEELMYDTYRQKVAGQQRDVFKGKQFSLDGSGLPGGGTFNSTLQSALEGLKGEYVKQGRRTSPKRRREGRSMVRQQLQALQGFAGELQGAQQAYRQAYDNDLISFGTQSEYIDLLNTLQGPNDLQIAFQDGRGALMGTSAGGKPISLPLDNLETLKNGLVLKGNNPQPVIAELIKETNKVTQGVDENGVKTENNAWTVDKTNMVENQLNSLVKSDNDVLSLGVDWLGYDPVKFKSLVQENPQEARQNVLDAMAYHVRAQHQAIDKGGVTQAQANTAQNQQERLNETLRHNRVTEGQAQQRIDKPGDTKVDNTPEQQAKFLQDLTQELDFISPGKGEKDFALSGLIGGKIKNATYKAPTRDTKHQFPDGHYQVEVAGGGKNFIDVHDKKLLLKYIAEANGVDPKLIETYVNAHDERLLGEYKGESNEIKSGTGERKTPAQLAAEYRARKKS